MSSSRNGNDVLHRGLNALLKGIEVCSTVRGFLGCFGFRGGEEVTELYMGAFCNGV